jgi:predicted RNA binding protein YcfA (HicA-like mRNA interferase family)
MSRIVPVPYSTLIRLFEKIGFSVSRTTGDHVIMVKENNARPLVIPKWDEDPVFIIKNNLRSANLSREEYLSIIKTV